MAQDISSIGSTGSSGIQSATDRASVDKTQFLKLLLAQLQHQDPLNPSNDPNEFTKQMTQFGQLEQLFNLNDSFKTLGAQQTRMERSESVNMIGKEVDAKNNLIEVRNNQASKIGVALTQPASSVEVQVVDTLGRVVRTLNYTNQQAGNHYYEFDGKNSSGEDLSGVYSVRINARSANDTSITSQAILRGTVEGVDYSTGTPILRVGNRLVKMEDIISINQAAI